MISNENLENYSDKNIGAFNVLQMISNLENQDLANVIWTTLVNNDIKGYMIWVLFSIISRQELTRMAEFCLSVPGNILKDACSQQDYSGAKIINDYLDSNPNKTTDQLNIQS